MLAWISTGSGSLFPSLSGQSRTPFSTYPTYRWLAKTGGLSGAPAASHALEVMRLPRRQTICAQVSDVYFQLWSLSASLGCLVRFAYHWPEMSFEACLPTSVRYRN